MEVAGITEELKACDPMRWVGLMNTLKAQAEEIASHISREVRIIVDREEAIKTAMSETTDSKDAVVIAGKGADAFQIVNGKRDNYAGDIEVAKKYL